MEISPNGITFLKGEETFSPKLYDDAGHPAIGYGCDLTPEEADQYEGVTITEEYATQLLLERLVDVQASINTVTVPLTQNQFDALCSFVYNVGIYAWEHSTLLRLLDGGDYEEAASQFPRWNQSGGKVNAGLTARRAKEQALFIKENADGQSQG